MTDIDTNEDVSISQNSIMDASFWRFINSRDVRTEFTLDDLEPQYFSPNL